MKKCVVTLLLISSSLSPIVAQAYCCCATKKLSSQMYVDVGISQALTYHVDPARLHPPDAPSNTFIFLNAKNSGGLPQSVSLGGGWLWPQLYRSESPYFPFVSAGLSYQHTNLFNTKKSVEFGAEASEMILAVASSAPYVFSQDILMANAKLDLYRWKYAMPYVSVGLGIAWNQVKDKAFFTSLETDFAPDVTDSNSRNTAFSYSAGIGLDFPVTEKFWLGLGYSYSGFGRMGGSNRLVSPTLSEELVLSSFGQATTQTILLTGRYVFA